MESGWQHSNPIYITLGGVIVGRILNLLNASISSSVKRDNICLYLSELTQSLAQAWHIANANKS